MKDEARLPRVCSSSSSYSYSYSPGNFEDE